MILIENVTRESGDTAIRSAAEEISALAGVIWREHYIPIVGEAQVEYMLNKYQSAERIRADIINDNFVYMTACSESGAVGYCAVQPREDCLFLSKIYVRKDCRRSGVARRFIEEAKRIARENAGRGIIRLGVNRHNDGSIAAYGHLGFEITGTMTTDIGGGFVMDDYLMELPGT